MHTTAPQPTPAAPENRAAFFDLDNTILRGASAYYFAREMYRRNFFGLSDLTRIVWMQTHFVAVGENLTHLEQIRERALSIIAGHTAVEVREMGEDVYDQVIARKLWPGTRALAQDHLDAGEQVWLVTATPIELAETIARRLGFTGALGTVTELVDGVYTGRLVGEPMHGPAKARAVTVLAQREKLDLASCAAYSDSVNDIPLLGLVGRPCAINPDAKLRAHARAEGWQIRDYRTARKVAKLSAPLVGTAAAGLWTGYRRWRQR